MKLNNIFFLLLLIFTGCKTTEEVQVNKSLSVDADMIKNIEIEYDDFTEYVDDQIDTISVEIIANTTNRTIQRAAIEMRKFFNKKLNKYDKISDPRKAFLNTWSLVYRFDNYITKGDGKSLFGSQQDLVIKTVSGILQHYEKIAQQHLSKKQYKTVARDLQNYAKEYPIQAYYQDVPETTSSAFSNFLTIPMAPFRAVNAINKSGESIESISKTVARFTDIAEDLPDDIRWQLQVLAAQLQQNDILKTNTESFKSLAETSRKLTEVVEKYPDKVSAKVEKAAKDLESTITSLENISKEIDASMAKLHKSSENFKNLGENVSESTEKITTSLKQVEDSSQALTKAADAVSKAVTTIQNYSEYLNKDSDPNEDQNKDSFLVEVERASIALEKSASEINQTLDKLITLGKSEPFSKEINELDLKAKETLLLTRAESEALVSYIFMKAIILVSIVFIMAILLITFKNRSVRINVQK